MAREKKPVHKVQMTEGKRNIIHQLLQEYDIETAEDIQDALKDLLGGTIKEMMEAEMDDHLGYGRSERSDSDDYRNCYKTKRVNSSYGSMEIEVPQDRKSTFESQVEYSGLGVRAVRWLGNRLAIIQNTRNLTNIKPANAPQSGSGLDIGSISYEWQLSQSKVVSVSGMQVSTAPESRFLDARIFTSG